MANIEIKISPQNLLPWSHMEDWVDGTSSPPTNHTKAGVGSTVARESTIVKTGTYSAALTRNGSNPAMYYHYPDYADYQGRKVTFGCWVYATQATAGRLSVNDGVGNTNSSVHTGGSSWEFLEVTHDVDSSATQLRVDMQVNNVDTTVYFDAAILCEGESTYTVLTDIVDVGTWKISNKYLSQNYVVPRREGGKNYNHRIDSKTISVEAMVIGDTPTEQRTNYDNLMKAINSVRSKPDGNAECKNLYLFDDRYYECFIETHNKDPIAATRIAKLKLNFKLPNPFLISTNKTRVNQSLSGTTTFTVTTNGTAVTRPVITVTNSTGGNVTSIVIENLTSGQKVSYTGTLADTKDLVIDCDALTVENDGSGDIANITNEVGLILVPGGNEIKVTGISTGDIDVDFFDRFY